MRTVGELLQDPQSNLAKNVDKARETMRKNDEAIAAWMAKGYSHTEAWNMALFGKPSA